MQKTVNVDLSNDQCFFIGNNSVGILPFLHRYFFEMGLGGSGMVATFCMSDSGS